MVPLRTAHAVVRIGIDRDVHFAGTASGRLESTEKESGAGTLMQSVAPDAYAGQRLRFSAVVRTRDVEGWTGLWMRVDRPDGRFTFDDMQQRPLRGSNEWTRVELVLDVAQDATAIHFGLLQVGKGVSWLDEATLEPVGKDVATTAIDPHPRTLVNTDFEDVPPRGDAIDVGIGLDPHGTLWLDDVKLEEVEKTAPLTSVVRERAAPENLGFER